MPDRAQQPRAEREQVVELSAADREIALTVAHTRPSDHVDTVLFIHGLGCAGSSFDGAWGTRLVERFALCAPDLPGHGRSGRPREFSYAMPALAELLGALLAELGAGRVHLVAHSMGGAVGLLLARALGPKLATFVNVEGNLVAADCGLISRRTARASFEKFRDRQLPVFQDAVSSSRQAALRAYGAQLAETDAWAFWRMSASLVEWSDRGELLAIFRDLEVPKLYVYGGRSVLPEVVAQLEGIESVGMDDSGHFVMHDAPGPFWAVVEQVLGERAEAR